ncbi:MAG: LysR family transcriptional regulator [Coriobacteriales bacterium]|nr:LysR family transcriptional regulator [Coriobacteriales bacterium]
MNKVSNPNSIKVMYLREFLSLAEMLNYTRSAEALFCAQSILSRHIQNLEQCLGVRLFTRSTHGVVLTEDGERAQKTFARIINEFDNYMAELADKESGAFGTLRVGILYYAIDDYLDDVFASFELRYPKLTVSVRSFQPPELNRALLDGVIDVGLTHRPSLPEHEGVQQRLICEEPLVVILPKANPLSGRERISVEELKDETFVFLESEIWHEPYVRRLLARHGLTPVNSRYTEQIDTLATTVMHEGGVAVAAAHVASGRRKGLTSAAFKESDMVVAMVLANLEVNDNPSLRLFLEASNDYPLFE